MGADCATAGVYARGEADTSLLIEQAINDGAHIISISSNYPLYNEDLRWAMARAISQGVIVVAAMGNESTEDPEDTLPLWSGICGVGAINADGSLTDYSNWGNGVETVALGSIVVRSGTSGEVFTMQGTSFATPIVAGFLAIAWQRFDDRITANQILQAMTTTVPGVTATGTTTRVSGQLTRGGCSTRMPRRCLTLIHANRRHCRRSRAGRMLRITSTALSIRC